MGEHDTWFHQLPGYGNLQAYLEVYLKRHWTSVGLERTDFSIAHVAVSAFISIVLILAAVAYAGKLRQSRLIPEKCFGLRNFFELVIDGAFGLAESIMGKKTAERFLPLLGTFVFFILFNNLIGLVPGFVSGTDTLKTNLALSGLVLVVTHLTGLSTHGLGWFKHFAGPIWWLTPLLLPIELLTHFVIRPGSLALRLMGNMFADHKLMGTIIMLVPLVVPLPFYVLGILVSVVQTLVFTLLAMIYIGEAASHHQEEEAAH